MVKIVGKRRLFFGLASLVVVGAVEVLVPAGWSTYGHLALISVVVSFYGYSAVDKFKNGRADG